MSTLDECYEILELTPTASLSEIRTSFRDLAMVWHPDRFQGNDRLREKAGAKIREINRAYRTLRSEYRRVSQRSPTTVPPSSATAPPSRERRQPTAAPPVSASETKVFGWYAEAAARGDADSQMIMAAMYAEGRGVPKDDTRAVEWYQRAAAQGYPPAQFQIGLRYHGGRGLPRDSVRAIDWYEKAAYGGYGKAQFYLGMIYSEGEGVAKDYVAAYAWFDVAAARGHRDAKSLRHALAKSLSPTQKTAATKLSARILGRIT